MGALRNGTIVSPLFSAFGPEPIATRIRLGGGAVLLITESLYRKKLAAIRDTMPTLRRVIVIGESGSAAPVSGTESFSELMAAASDDADLTPTTEDDPALLHFTSGTTGTPKVQSTFTAPSRPTTQPASTHSTCTQTTSTGAPPTPPAGSPARHTESSHHYSTASPR